MFIDDGHVKGNAVYLPNPRSTRNNFFSSGVPGGPSKKFSGFTSPCTYLQ